MLFNRFPNLNHRSQKLFTRIRQIRQLPLHFPKNCVRIRQTCISMRRVPRAQRGECLAFSAPLERRLCIFTQLNGASKNRDRPSAQTNTVILTSQPNAKRAVDDAFLQQNQGKRRRKCPPAPAPFAFKEIH